ncbi:hypothetical protein [Streptomyces poonensis]|uniref:Uncharacterized protein n=1 Tax=Streptomyces poonensis TaxID=68255 RepID=A0A918QAI9_9ACTN|nr:hypothetical protein [Streptomyces poonensis]GGZ39267.1 hypothetical protein GCM10010365_70030 [Streptomyces poonensis]GLJ93105.1 hypothetical protein GCM10017589_57170 [Streptomyces poonensis]
MPYPQQPYPGGNGSGAGGSGGGGDQGNGLKKVVIGVVVLAVLAVLGVGGLAMVKAVGGGSLPTAGGGAQGKEVIGPEVIAELLKGRSEALQSGDEDAYLAPFTGKAKETQKKLFNNLRKIPFAQAEYSVLNQTGSGDAEYGDGATVAVDVAFVHMIEDVDVRPVSEWYRWVVKRESENAEPVITKVGPSPGAYGSETYVYYPAPWDLYDDMHVVRQDHTITISDKKHAADTDRFAPYVEKAAKDDIELWESSGPSATETPTGFLTVLEPDRERYTSLYGAGSVDWEAGQSVAMPTFDAGFGGDEDDLEYGGARIKMDSSQSRFTAATRWELGVEEISHHEFAHAIVQPLEAASSGFGAEGMVRTWVGEGFAEWVALRFDTELAGWRIQRNVSGKFDGKLPNWGSDGIGASSGYTLGYMAFRFIAEKSGDDAALQFVTDHYRKPDQLDQQLQQAVGMGESEFEAAWAAYVRSHS